MYLFNLVFLQSSEAAGSDGSGTWLASPFVWWLCTGKRRDVLHLQLPWAAIALYQNLFSLGTFTRSKSRFAVPPDTAALWDVIASKHSLGGWGQEGHTGTQAGWEMWVLWASCWPLPNSLLSACWLHGPAIVQKWWCPPPHHFTQLKWKWTSPSTPGSSDMCVHLRHRLAELSKGARSCMVWRAYPPAPQWKQVSARRGMFPSRATPLSSCPHLKC